MAKLCYTGNTKYWLGRGATGTLTHVWLECKRVQPLWKAVWWFLIKPNTLTIQPSNHDPWHIQPPKELKTQVHTKACMLMIIASLFIIAKTWKPPTGHSATE